MAKKETKEKEEKVQRIYSKEELSLFDQSLNKYQMEVTNDKGEKVMILDWETIRIKAGVMSPKGVIVYEKPDGSTYVPLLEFNNKVDQWSYWKAGFEFGQRERFKAYEKTDHQKADDEYNSY